MRAAWRSVGACKIRKYRGNWENREVLKVSAEVTFAATGDPIARSPVQNSIERCPAGVAGRPVTLPRCQVRSDFRSERLWCVIFLGADEREKSNKFGVLE